MALGAVVCVAFYLLSAAPVLRLWEIEHYDPAHTHDFRAPGWWDVAYAPVCWLAGQSVTQEPVLWLPPVRARSGHRTTAAARHARPDDM